MGFNFREFAENYSHSLVETIQGISLDSLEDFWKSIEEVRSTGGTVHFIGNGGSAGTPSHSAGDWSKELSLRTISHVDNASALTAWANDTDYDNVFAGQLSTFTKPGDLVVAFSGSGNSKNVLNGIKYAKENGCRTFAITGDYRGMGGGKLKELVDQAIVIPSNSMERIEDMQLIINHIVKEAIKSNNGL